MQTNRNVLILFLLAVVTTPLAASELSHSDSSPRNTANTNVTHSAEMLAPKSKSDDDASKAQLGLTKDEESILRAGFLSPEKDREIGLICLRRRLSRQQILALLGEQWSIKEERKIAYQFAPSQRLVIYFDARDNVAKVVLNGIAMQLIESDKAEK